MSFYQEIRDEVASPIIQEFGTDVKFSTIDNNGTTTNRTAKVVFANVESKGSAHFGDSGIQIGDWYCLAEASASPNKGDMITVGGVRYVVAFVEPIAPGGETVAFKLWARRA